MRVWDRLAHVSPFCANFFSLHPPTPIDNTYRIEILARLWGPFRGNLAKLPQWSVRPTRCRHGHLAGDGPHIVPLFNHVLSSTGAVFQGVEAAGVVAPTPNGVFPDGIG